ncbi:MAG TPA: NAD(P)H-dependent oxidoreductase [Polyangiaceae bacterium]|nr:NAD(P)H-dependent oxidoreductase [Polyangiaceae bacterium]
MTAALILGSARRTGWTRKLAQALMELAPTAISLRAITIADLPLYHEELEEPSPPPEWARFRSELRDVDAVLFVTPEYNRSVPAALKNAVDIGSSPDGASVWAGKPAAIVSHSPGRMGGFGANHHLRQSLVFLDMPVLQQPEVYLVEVDKLFDSDGRLTDRDVRELLSNLLAAFRDFSLTLRAAAPKGSPR